MPVGRFQSTLSVRRATRAAVRAIPEIAISIHALRKESDFDRLPALPEANISIHALRKESDFAAPPPVDTAVRISIHALRKESDVAKNNNWSDEEQFQSTLSVRRATGKIPSIISSIRFQSTLSVRRATTPMLNTAITALQFQSTLSVRRATAAVTIET